MKQKCHVCKIFIFIILLNIFITPIFSQDTSSKPYDEKEFPQFLNDLRRFEIISLGSLPFVTLDVTLAYSGYRYVKNDFSDEYKPNIFSKTSYTKDEQKGILLSSLGISVGIGLTDYIVQIIKRTKQKKQDNVKYEDINIYPISEDPDATKIELPNEEEISIPEDEIIPVTEIPEIIE